LLALVVCVVLAALGLINLFHFNTPALIFLGQLSIPCLSLTIVIAFIGTVLQNRPVIIIGAITAVIFAIGLMPWLLIRDISDSTPGPHLKVMYAYAPANDQGSVLLYNFIARTDPDLIALGEPSLDVAVHAPNVLTSRYPYSRQVGSINLFSKTPLDTMSVDFFDERFISVRLATPIGPIRLTTARLPRLWPYSEPEAYDIELGRLKRMSLENLNEPTLIIGDFNATLSAPPLLDFVGEGNFKPLTSPIGTWPARAPPYFRLAIDHAFVSPQLTGTNFTVGPEFASDHRPIVVDVQKNNP
jgi:hypothetical protein